MVWNTLAAELNASVSPFSDKFKSHAKIEILELFLRAQKGIVCDGLFQGTPDHRFVFDAKEILISFPSVKGFPIKQGLNGFCSPFSFVSEKVRPVNKENDYGTNLHFLFPPSPEIANNPEVRISARGTSRRASCHCFDASRLSSQGDWPLGLFQDIEKRNQDRNRPLADRMRPRSIEEFVGQEVFWRRQTSTQNAACKTNHFGDFYGPPGTGKTTLARLIADHVQGRFIQLNAADCGVKEVRQVIEEARDHSARDSLRTVLFLDEMHHFNRTQQDILLPHVENGTIVLIGATTQNPFFAINARW